MSSEFSIFSNFQQWVYISFITLKNTNYTFKIFSLCFLKPCTALVIKARHHLPVINYRYFLTDPLALSCILCWNLCNQLCLFPYQYLILAPAFWFGFLIMSRASELELATEIQITWLKSWQTGYPFTLICIFWTNEETKSSPLRVSKALRCSGTLRAGFFSFCHTPSRRCLQIKMCLLHWICHLLS